MLDIDLLPEGRRVAPKVTVVSHAYNGPGRMVPFLQAWEWANVQLIGPRRHVGGPLSVQLGAGSIDIRPLRSVRLMRTQFLMWGVAKSLRQFRPDVILVEYDPWQLPYLQTWAASLLAGAGSAIVPVAKKNTFRAPSSPLGRLKVWVTRFLLREVPAIVTASDLAKRMYVSFFDVEASAVLVQPHMAVDTARFAPHAAQSDERITIGFVGRVNETKGVPDLLAAFEVLQIRNPDREIRLLLVGQCDDAALKARIAQNEAIELLSPVNNDALPEVLHMMDVFVMPTQILPDHEEHDGRAVLEAMSSGLPCVVSSSGILPELVGSEEGRVYRAGSGELLVEALEEVAFDPVLRARLGLQARQRALREVSPDSLAAMRRETISKALERRPMAKDSINYTAREEYLAPKVADEYVERRFTGWLGRYRFKCEQAGVNSLIRRVEIAGGAERILDCPTGIGRWTPNLMSLVPRPSLVWTSLPRCLLGRGL